MSEKGKFDKVKQELEEAYAKLKYIKKGVNIFGSARTTLDKKYLNMAEEIAYRLAIEGFTIITGGGPGCVDAMTEYFNGTEWIPISEYCGGKVAQYTKEGQMEIVTPKSYLKYPSKFINLVKTKYGINQALCDNHRVIYLTENGNIKEKLFKEVKKIHNKNVKGFSGRFITTFQNDSGTELPYTDNELRLLVAVIADGTFKNSDRVQFGLKKERKIRRLQGLLKETGIEYTQGKMGESTSFYFKSPRKIKYFDKMFYNASPRQLEVIGTEVVYWDGSEGRANRGPRFSSTNKESIDFIQYTWANLGLRTSILEDTRTGKYKNTCYELQASTATTPSFIGKNGEKVEIKQIPTIDGIKYCFVVDSGMLILRREGRIFITGNCMEAGNKGAMRAGKKSVGLNIELPFEQEPNEYITELINFKYFYTRKVCFTISSMATIALPGGWGTMDEVFEQLTLIQTGKIPPRSFILVGSKYYKNLIKFMKDLINYQTIDKQDFNLITIADDTDTIVKTIVDNYNSQRKKRYI